MRKFARRVRPLWSLLLLVAIVVLGACQPTPPAFPPLPDGSGDGRRVVYSIEQQRVWWVEEDGRVVNSYLVSGRRNTPAKGTYAVFSKSRHAWSGEGATMEHMIRFTWGNTMAIGFHSIPRDGAGRPLQTEAQLGQPLSSGCIRQRDADAAALFDWAQVGTKVVVVK